MTDISPPERVWPVEMDCASLAPQIDALADGEAAPQAQAHVAECDACRERLEAARALTAALADGLAAEPLPEDAARRLHHRIASEVRTQQRTRARRPSPVRLEAHRRRGMPLLAAAAAFLAVAVPVAWMVRERPAVEPAVEPSPIAAAPVPQPADLPAVESPPLPAAQPAGAAALALDRQFAAAWSRNDFDGAAALLDRIIAEYPGYVRVRYGTLAHFRIACDGRRRRWADALAGTRRFFTTHPDSPHIDYIRYFEVVYLARLGRFDEAMARRAELLAAEPPSKYAANLRALERFIAQLRAATPTSDTPR